MKANRTQFFHMPDLRDQAHKLYRRGGPFRKCGEKVIAILELIAHDEPNPLSDLKMTKHGETRLDKCIKYDLPGACRLVTIQDAGKIILLFVGDHDDEEKWLNANRGREFVADKDGKIDEVRVIAKTLQPGEKPAIDAVYSDGPLFEQLPAEAYDRVINDVPRSIAVQLEKLHCFSKDDELFSIVEKIENEAAQLLILDVFIILMQGDKQGALKRIRLEDGEYSAMPEEALGDGDRIHTIPWDDPGYAELFAHYVRTASYKQWMLFMDRRQQEMVDIDFPGSSKLLGVSGSGKTCIVVKRAVRLAKKYPGERVLVVTLNRSLARLINELVCEVASEAEREQIDVLPFFQVCQDYLSVFEPENRKLYDDITWKSQEHIDEVWQEYYRCELNFHKAEVLHPVHDYLIAQGVNAERYIRSEFDWIRSALPRQRRGAYRNIEREGRAIPFSPAYRDAILKGLLGWEEKMQLTGVTDYLGLTTALSAHEDKLAPKYRCTLIDESQDFGTQELAILRRITKDDDNDVMVFGDAAQTVSTKFQSFQKAGIVLHSAHSRKIMRNYRNSREILTAASKVLEYGGDDILSGSSDFEILAPEYSNFSDSFPLLLSAGSLQEELGRAFAFARTYLAEGEGRKACIAICGFSQFELERFGRAIKIGVIDNSTSLADGDLFISDLEQTKGFEFDLMLIVNAGSAVIPDVSAPLKEQVRDLKHLYVAMTRAKLQLVVSYSGDCSPYIKYAESEFLAEPWEVYQPEFEKVAEKLLHIDDLRTVNGDAAIVLFKRGADYLYSSNAIGMDQLLIGKLRQFVTGDAVKTDNVLRTWRNIGSCYDSLKDQPRCRQAFGTEGIKQLYAHFETHGLAELMGRVSKQNLYLGNLSELVESEE